MGSIGKELDRELLPFLRVYKDGFVERLTESPIVPTFSDDPETGVTSKDIIISENPLISARIYLPKLTHLEGEPTQKEKLPILVYFHGGGFCFESAFSLVETKLMTSLVSEARIVAISVEYRLAPEHPQSVGYEDCWAGLQWVASHSFENDVVKEPWISTHGDFDRVFIGGDSAGANLAHNILLRAGSESLPGGVKISGGFLTHPYFWGSDPIGSEPTAGKERDTLLPYTVWTFLNPTVDGGIDNHMINPFVAGAPSLGGLGCSRLLVSVAEKDVLRERGVLYSKTVKESGWKGEVELVEVEGEDHAFHILNYESESAKKLIKRLASFLVMIK